MNENITKAVELALEKDKPVIVLKPEDIKDRGNIVVHHQNYRVSRVTPVEPQYVHRFALEDLESIEDYAKRFVEPEKGAICFDDKGVSVLQDAKEPFHGRARYDFKPSNEVQDWLQCGEMKLRDFRDFLEAHYEDLVDQTIYASLAVIKLNTTTTFSEAAEDDVNVTLAYEQKGAEGSTKIPKKIEIQVPLLVNSTEQWKLEFRIRHNTPGEKEQMVFRLECVKWEIIWRAAVRRRIAELKEALEGYHFYAGVPNTEEISFELYGVTNDHQG